MRIVHAVEARQLTNPMIHRRSRGGTVSQKTAGQATASIGSDQPLHLHDKQIIVIIESEGAVFDINRYRHETAYLPSFIGCFGGNVDPAVAGEVWRTVALESSLRGEHPLIVLLAALRVLNVLFPSMQRAVVIKALEKYSFSENTLDDLFRLEERPPAEMMIIDWFSMADGLIQELGRVPHFSTAEEFLRSAQYVAPRSEILVYSSLAEMSAMRMWQNAGLGECFYRIAGKERGRPGEYLRAALSAGFDRSSIVAIGSSASMFKASQLAGVRFFPIAAGQEEESWKILAEQWFPAYLRGEAWKIDMQAEAFYEQMCSEFNVARIARNIETRLKLQRTSDQAHLKPRTELNLGKTPRE